MPIISIDLNWFINWFGIFVVCCRRSFVCCRCCPQQPCLPCPTRNHHRLLIRCSQFGWKQPMEVCSVPIISWTVFPKSFQFFVWVLKGTNSDLLKCLATPDLMVRPAMNPTPRKWSHTNLATPTKENLTTSLPKDRRSLWPGPPMRTDSCPQETICPLLPPSRPRSPPCCPLCPNWPKSNTQNPLTHNLFTDSIWALLIFHVSITYEYNFDCKFLLF